MPTLNFLEEYQAAAEDDEIDDRPLSSSAASHHPSSSAPGKRKRSSAETDENTADEEDRLEDELDDDNVEGEANGTCGREPTGVQSANSGHSADRCGSSASLEQGAGGHSTDRNLTTYAKQLGHKKRLCAELCDDLVKFSQVRLCSVSEPVILMFHVSGHACSTGYQTLCAPAQHNAEAREATN